MTDASRSARLVHGEAEKEKTLARNGKLDSSQAQPPQSASGDTSTPEADCDRIVAAIGQRYRTFGGGRDSDMNPIAHALRNEPLAFATGVDVRAVVEFVQSELASEASAPRPEPHGMPNEHMNLWRLLKQIQGWSVSIIFHAHEAQTGRKKLDADEIMAIGRLIEKASDLTFVKLQVARKEIDCDF